ncbi:MAG TPA: hypothetical protein VNM92_03000 [Thermoanaerobaculia bacterium]|nr:hypothetical protein [Thermoanaerobaculia bacterium]
MLSPSLTGSPGEPAMDARALAALAKSRNFCPKHLGLLLRMKELILLAKGLALGHWRESRDPLANSFAEHGQAEIMIAELRETLDIIRGRILRMAPAERQHYTPEERFRIVVFLRTYAHTYEAAAALFMVDAQTIGR